MKPINRYTTNEFHPFVREHLTAINGRRLIIQDADSLSIYATTFRPFGLKVETVLEFKRSHLEPEVWKPYPEDRNNYAAMLELARPHDAPALVVYWKKGIEIEPLTLLQVRELTAARPEYEGPVEIMTAGDFAARWREGGFARD